MRFEDFNRHELHVITEALEWSMPEFFDPGHTREDRDVLRAMLAEAGAAAGKTVETPQDTLQDAEESGVMGGYDRGGHPIIRKPDGSSERITTQKPPRQDQGGRTKQPGEYTGFLYIECAHCGRIHAFCAKKPIRTYRCEECGGRTPLIDMYPLRVACECGARFHYMTNIVTGRMDVACFRCDAPIAVEWVGKLRRYQPMSYHPAKKGKKSGTK